MQSREGLDGSQLAGFGPQHGGDAHVEFRRGPVALEAAQGRHLSLVQAQPGGAGLATDEMRMDLLPGSFDRVSLEGQPVASAMADGIHVKGEVQGSRCRWPEVGHVVWMRVESAQVVTVEDGRQFPIERLMCSSEAGLHRAE